MAINKPTIAAGSTLTRASTETVIVEVIREVPPGPYTTRNSDGKLVSIEYPPITEGAIVLYRPQNSRLAELYVTVDVDGALSWVPVSVRTVISDAATGKAWDPLANQYSILAY